MLTIIVLFIAVCVILLEYLIYSKLSFWNLTYTYNISSDEVNEGDIFYLTEILENRKILPIPYVTTVLDLMEGISFVNENDTPLKNKLVFGISIMGPFQRVERIWRLKAFKRG